MLLDEVQFLSPTQLESLISALHTCVQRNLPVTVVGAGLPQIAQLAGEATSYAERLFTFPVIGNLTYEQAHGILQQPARAEGAEWEPDALCLAAQLTGTYPFFLQEPRYAVWPAASAADVARLLGRSSQQVGTARAVRQPDPPEVHRRKRRKPS